METREELNAQAEALLAKLPPAAELKAPQRMAIPQQPMPAQDPKERIRNNHEVAIGYTEAQARLEALRCLQCPTKPCVAGCPVGIDIPAFIHAIAEGKDSEAIGIIKQTSLLPSVCGRVCPQERQCMKGCTVGKINKDVGKAVAIGRLERFVADKERETGSVVPPAVAAPTGKKVAVIGSGPASLAFACDARRAGHDVTIFEALQKSGGVLSYGIPEFRLPKDIVQKEVENLQSMGVTIRNDFIVGRSRPLKRLFEKDGFDAAFIGSGAGLPRFMGIEGENLIGVFSANEYLTRANLMRAYDTEHADTPFYHAKRVAILGGGNVAMDAARTALRLGAESVQLFYRRTMGEMPARAEEIEHAKEEGVEFNLLRNPVRILGDENDIVRGMEVLCYELGEPDASGRRSPIAVKGSEYEVEVDCVVVAIGNSSNPLLPSTTPELKTNARGNILVDENHETSMRNVYAGGDIVLGAATVILAMGEGRAAAKAMNERLAGER